MNLLRGAFHKWGPPVSMSEQQGRLGPAPHHCHKYRVEATGVSKAEGHCSVLTLFFTLCPTTFHPSPSASALRWALLHSHPRAALTTAAAASHGGDTPVAGREGASHPPAGQRERRFAQNPSLPPAPKPLAALTLPPSLPGERGRQG